MKERQSDHIENKIREAAEQVSFPFDEDAWSRMEALLDDKPRKRRFIWWPLLFVFLLTGVSSVTIYRSLRTPSNVTAENVDKHDVSKASDERDAVISPLPEVNQLTISQNTSDFKTAASFLHAKENKAMASVEGYMTKDENLKYRENIKSSRQKKREVGINSKMYLTPGIIQEDNEAKKTANDKNAYQQSDVKIRDGYDLVSEIISTSENENGEVDKKVVPVGEKQTMKTDSSQASLSATDDRKKSKRANRFYFYAGGGIESSSVKFPGFSNGKVLPRFGGGLGYAITKQVSVQTGLFISRKKYIAGSSDYKTGDTYIQHADFISADANCLVYEIPLSVRYSFSGPSKNQFYVTAGVSSVIMKSEKYKIDYLYYGSVSSHNYEYYGNKHLFSHSMLSAGIEHSLSSKFSLLVEPYISVPFSGVGNGKVKLYTSGINIAGKFNL